MSDSREEGKKCITCIHHKVCYIKKRLVNDLRNNKDQFEQSFYKWYRKSIINMMDHCTVYIENKF